MSALLTDWYQLTMLKTYWEHGMTEPAVFELFFRRLPASRNYLMAAGLEQVVEFLEQLHFSEEELRWLAAREGFDHALIERLRALRFTGDVDAMPEGTVFFPDEPVLRVVAPLPQAQLVESRVMNLMHFQTLIASKAARAVTQAPGKLLVDFGLRRAHGAEAGLLAARAGYLAGLSGTATVAAGMRFGIPVVGTMAHAFIQAHDDEALAFERFARGHPDNVTLLIDTYDTEEGARKVARLAPRLHADGIRIAAVRLDSGDLARHAHQVRRILDEHGLHAVRIFASGGLDEYALRTLLAEKRAPIDGFGIGSALDTSGDAPTLDCAYKLQEYAGRARRKKSEGKATWPGRKQVYRRLGDDDLIQSDLLALLAEPATGEALLQPVMRAGRRVGALPSLDSARRRARAQLASLPAALRALEPVPAFVPEVSPGVRNLARRVDEARARRDAQAEDRGAA